MCITAFTALAHECKSVISVRWAASRLKKVMNSTKFTASSNATMTYDTVVSRRYGALACMMRTYLEFGWHMISVTILYVATLPYSTTSKKQHEMGKSNTQWVFCSPLARAANQDVGCRSNIGSKSAWLAAVRDHVKHGHAFPSTTSTIHAVRSSAVHPSLL
jgi:hypothetical protein